MALINQNIKKADPSIIKQYKKISAATAHEAMNRKGYIDCRIRPLYDGMKVCGSALTCECPEMDNITLHAALHIAETGDVIVCKMGGYYQQGPFGDCLATIAVQKGVDGLVIDSGVRDGDGIKKIGFNVFSRGHCINGTNKEVFGNVNNPIAFGGQIINPGDIIIGDDDGLVVVPLEISEEVLKKSFAIIDLEEQIRQKFLAGIDSWELNKFSEKMRNKGFDLDI